MKYRTHIICLVLICAVSAVFADEARTGSSMGFHLGTSSASGYSMRFMGPKNGIQLTTGAFTLGSNNVKFADRIYIYEEEAAENEITIEKSGKEVSFNLGANYIHTLDDFGSGRLFVIAGGAYSYRQEREFSNRYSRESPGSWYYNIVPGTEHDKTITEHNWVAGVGPGVELNLGRKFAFSFELPLTINQDSDIVMYIPQIGIYYYFK